MSNAVSPRVERSQVLGWCLFDVANSSYTTAIITVFFGRIFAEVIVGPSQDTSNPFALGNFWWSLLLSISWLLAALIGPFLGAMSDLGRRKQFLAASVALCVLNTALLYTAGPGMILWASALVVVSNLGFALSENFISAFLPHISTPENIAKISGWSWGLGYFGGIACISICAALVQVSDYGVDNFSSLRWIGPITAAFFLVFSIPTFLLVKEPSTHVGKKFSFASALQNAYSEFGQTFVKLREFPDLARFLLSFFFFYGGLSIVISFSAMYAAQVVGLKDSTWQLIFFLVINVSAAVGAVLFGYVQSKIGALKTVDLTLLIWIATILGIYFLPQIAASFGTSELRYPFIAMGTMAGGCLGATQSASRALVGLLSPVERSGEFYGFWGLAGKLAAVSAVLSFGALQMAFDLETAMLLCSLFFVAGLLINRTVKEDRGLRRARE